MSFAAVLAGMPDLLARALAEHVPDADGRCRECRADGTAAAWPCAMRLIAEQANGMVDPAADPAADPAVDIDPDTVVDTVPQRRVVSESWDPIADRHAYHRDGFG